MQYNRLLVFACANTYIYIYICIYIDCMEEIAEYIYMCMEMLRYCMQDCCANIYIYIYIYVHGDTEILYAIQQIASLCMYK